MISFDKNSSKDEAFRFFTANVDDVLKESIELLMRGGPKNDISEEVALYKLSMLNRVQLYQAALKSGKPEAIDKAADILQDGLRGIADMVKIQAQLDQLTKDKYTIEQVGQLINAFIDLVYKVCNKSGRVDIADEIEEQVKKQSNITLRPRGVTFTPADDVEEMIRSVPRI